MTYGIVDVIEAYMSGAKTTTTQMEPREILPFPTVTICPQSKEHERSYDFSGFFGPMEQIIMWDDENFQQLAGLDDPMADLPFSFYGENRTADDDGMQETCIRPFAAGSHDSLSMLGFVEEQLGPNKYVLDGYSGLKQTSSLKPILYCSFNEGPCHDGDFEYMELHSRGNCFTFNSDRKKYVRRNTPSNSGFNESWDPWQGLRLVLAPYSMRPTSIGGYTVFVWRPGGEDYALDEGADAKLGAVSYVGLKMVEFQRLRPEFGGDCAPDSYLRLRFDPEVFVVTNETVYSKEVCRDYCIASRLLQEYSHGQSEVDCLPFSYSSLLTNNEIPTCAQREHFILCFLCPVLVHIHSSWFHFYMPRARRAHPYVGVRVSSDVSSVGSSVVSPSWSPRLSPMGVFSMGPPKNSPLKNWSSYPTPSDCSVMVSSDLRPIFAEEMDVRLILREPDAFRREREALDNLAQLWGTHYYIISVFDLRRVVAEPVERKWSSWSKWTRSRCEAHMVDEAILAMPLRVAGRRTTPDSLSTLLIGTLVTSTQLKLSSWSKWTRSRCEAHMVDEAILALPPRQWYLSCTIGEWWGHHCRIWAADHHGFPENHRPTPRKDIIYGHSVVPTWGNLASNGMEMETGMKTAVVSELSGGGLLWADVLRAVIGSYFRFSVGFNESHSLADSPALTDASRCLSLRKNLHRYRPM
ncbi:unnamed protein product [Darwinula stevensoni]|uniref:Uncharacterized protein n=1 Tax=Darwinula stevensoni TaxID=69355 RepID=A0A7R9AAM1_9CRUS|nr:unnamed protein product [Darwinula stevensoni]CAG0898561.1 unnamed protein product [Darwinula stevensoni]